jgi:diguanylate cyclase (GGDEF)-like protein
VSEITPRLRSVTRGLQALLLALVLLYVVLLAVPIPGFHAHWNPVRDLWLSTAALTLAVVLVAMRAVLVPAQRAAWACFAGAGASWTIGFVYFVLVVRRHVELPFPTWADVGFLGFCPLAWCGVALLSRRRRGLFHAILWLDGCVVGLAAAAGATVALPWIVTASGGSFDAVATNLTYPVADIVLLTAIVGAVAHFGKRAPRAWLMLAIGICAFTLTDTMFLLRIATGSFVIGTTWDAGWLVGLAAFALAAWQMDLGEPKARPSGWVSVAVPLISGLLGLALLIVSAVHHLHTFTVVAAAGCVLAGQARTALSARDAKALGLARREARTDDLTGLSNRRHFYSRLAEALDAPTADRPLAVILIDLDRFKQINDSLGHHVGDTLIQVVAQRLARTLRPGDLLARLGGDEFAVIVAGANRESAETAAKRLRDALQAPFVLEELTLHLDASFGVALVSQDEDEGDVDLVLQRADLAMYQAKSSGSGLETYSHLRHGGAADRLVTTEELRSALYNDQLVLHYQPKLTIATGEVGGVEALVRWQHPARGLLYPDDFIALAEAAGLMPALTTVVLDQALQQCAAWRRVGLDLSVAVNLSASDLLDTELPSLIGALLTNLDLPSSAVELEITETMLLSDTDKIIPILERLAAAGLRIAIDDYGTGYSSLEYLVVLPVHDLKLDQSFIRAMDGDSEIAGRATSVVSSTIALARGLGLGFVAEGVETGTSLARLTELGCETVQGFYISRPLPAAELAAWVATRRGVDPVRRAPLPQSESVIVQAT